MTTRRIGSIIGFQNEPSIYVIVKRNCIYIGETQRLPVSRWGEHLCNFGTFSKKLYEYNDELAESNKFALYFFAYRCQELLEHFQAKDLIKRNTQYIEDLLHRKFVSHNICTKFTLISDTEKTAPIRSNTDQAEIIAESIFEAILEDLKIHLLKS